MALQSTGAISLAQIGSEFDLTPPYKLSDINKMMNRHPETTKQFTDFYGTQMSSDIPVVFSTNTTGVSELTAVADPPTILDIFNTWARFDGSAYYADKASASGQSLDWQLLTAPDRILMPTNTAVGNGFISPESLDNYTIEATLFSDNDDDDSIGLVAAFSRDNGVNNVLKIVRTQAGTPPYNGFGAQVTVNGALYGWTITDIDVGGTNKNGDYPGDGLGWHSRSTKVKIERTGDIIKAWASPWDSDILDETSVFTIDLSTDSRYAPFRGPRPYGYYTHSQANSTYLDVTIRGAVDLSSVYNISTGTLTEYDGVNWIVSAQSIQDTVGYITRIVNPFTQQIAIVQSKLVENIRYWIGKDTSQNFIDYQSWETGAGVQPVGFRINGGSNENEIINDTDPFGNSTKVWRAIGNTSTSDSDGGWHTMYHKIDSDKLYRKTIWVKRVALGNGSWYFGTHGDGEDSGLLQIDTLVSNTNPYFDYGSWDKTLDKWYLVVGHVHPSDTTTTVDHPDSGWYEVGNPNKLFNLNRADFKWKPGNTQTYHRTYLYYSTDAGTDQRWCYPRLEEINSFEPSISDLVNGFEESRTPPICKNCLEWLKEGYNMSGIYKIYPASDPAGLMVYCDQVTDGGGWTLLSSYGEESGGYFDSTNFGAANIDSPSITTLYSIVDRMDDIVSDNSTYNIMLQIKHAGTGNWYQWISKQSISPLTYTQVTGQSVPGLEKISTTADNWGNFMGYGKDNTASSYINGGCLTAESNWFWNMCSIKWVTGIPIACGATAGSGTINLGASGTGNESNHNKAWIR